MRGWMSSRMAARGGKSDISIAKKEVCRARTDACQSRANGTRQQSVRFAGRCGAGRQWGVAEGRRQVDVGAEIAG